MKRLLSALGGAFILAAGVAVLFAATLFVAHIANAQLPMQHAGKGAPGGAAAYVGPGDLGVTGVDMWWGLRCYSTSYTGNVIDIVDHATGNTTGSRIQCSAGGTMAALVSGSACTFVTGNACSSIATTCAVACDVNRWYDQSGANKCTAAPCNITAGTPPAFTQNCPTTGLFCLTFTRASSQRFFVPNIVTLAIAQPYSFSFVSNLTSLPGSSGIFGDGSNGIVYKTGPVMDFFAASDTSVAVTAAALHAFQIVGNGAAGNCTTPTGSCTNIDGTGTPISPGTASLFNGGSGTVFVGDDGFTETMQGNIMELGIWSGAFSSTTQNTLCHNQRLYWGSGGSC